MNNRMSIPLIQAGPGLRLIKAPPDVGPVEAKLIRRGFTFGVPETLTEESARADVEACNTADCGQCGSQGMLWKPYFKGELYNAVSSCPRCGFQEQM